MDKPFIEIDAKDVIIHPFELPKPDGYKFPDNYPNCCYMHKHNYKLLEDHFKIFPNCCDAHRKFYKNFKFDKNKIYKDMPLRVLNAVEFTIFQIKEKIDNEDWFEDITEYIEYATKSLGHPPAGLYIYLELVTIYVKDRLKTSRYKVNTLIKHFDKNTHYTIENKKTDLNILYHIYSKWLKIFPFEIPFFQGLKPELSKSLPFIKGIKKHNRYLGTVKAKIITPTELVKSLYKRTNHILSLIDTTELVKNGSIKDTDKLKIDLINQNHQFKQKTLLNKYTAGEKQYIKTIKKWLQNEKEFFQEITPEIKDLPATKNKSSIKNKTSKVSFGYKQKDTQKLLAVIIQLNFKIGLLNEMFTSPEQLVQLLTSKDFTKEKIKIYIGCETTQFRYIIDKMKPHFNNFTLISIERSNKFFTLNNIPFTAQNLYSNKIENPKEKESIDKIFQQL